MTIKKEDVGKRLSEFAARFRSQSELARALGMKKHQQLYPYLKGQSLPGFEIIAKLRDLGCDPNWLIAGESGTPQAPKWEEGKLEYDSDKVVKMAQISFGAMKPIQARELREALRRWAIKQYRMEHQETEKTTKKLVKAK
jgi:transcriptional regulator with XRE-family HTH domain